MVLVLALLVGAALALLGAGGSVVTVPLLVYGAGLDAPHATGTSLVVVGLVAATGALLQRRVVRVRTGVLLGVAGMLGAVPGAWLNHALPPVVVLCAFASITVAAAATLVRRPVPERPDATGGPTVHPAMAVAVGVTLGVGTGFLGIGGGFLVVPALTLLLGFDVRSAIATSLLVIAMNCAAGLLAHARYGTVSWSLGLEVGTVAVIGALVAVPLGGRIAAAATRRAFAAVLATMGGIMLIDGIRRLAG
jgi:uncharacterized membrane protein YfcA